MDDLSFPYQENIDPQFTFFLNNKDHTNNSIISVKLSILQRSLILDLLRNIDIVCIHVAELLPDFISNKGQRDYIFYCNDNIKFIPSEYKIEMNEIKINGYIGTVLLKFIRKIESIVNNNNPIIKLNILKNDITFLLNTFLSITTKSPVPIITSILSGINILNINEVYETMIKFLIVQVTYLWTNETYIEKRGYGLIIKDII